MYFVWPKWQVGRCVVIVVRTASMKTYDNVVDLRPEWLI